MRGSILDLPVSIELPEGKIWQVEWGGNTVEFGRFQRSWDPSELLRGLPADSCQCPHWGYVLKGSLRVRYREREEVYRTGDAYYIPPGHIPLYEAGLEYVEISPTRELAKTLEVIDRHLSLNNAKR